eukprot:5170684-Prymnesium_polylepis.1
MPTLLASGSTTTRTAVATATTLHAGSSTAQLPTAAGLMIWTMTEGACMRVTSVQQMLSLPWGRTRGTCTAVATGP